MSRNTISSIFSDSSCSECNDREDDQDRHQTTEHENEADEEVSTEALIPSTRVQMDGSITVHRKHRKITTRGLRTLESRKKKKSISILKELKRTNETLEQKLRKTDKRIRNMEDKLKCATSINKGKSSHVPNGVRKETRRIYQMLIDEDPENFEGWKIEPGITYKDTHNQAVQNRLIREVKSLNPNFLTSHIRGAAYRFYRSKSEDVSIRRRGMGDEKNKKKRRYERRVRKLHERKATFERANFDDPAMKEKWKDVLNITLMSSDESEIEEDGTDVIVNHKLPWLTDVVEDFKQMLDAETLQGKTQQALRQTKNRKTGAASTRPEPTDKSYLPSWIFIEN